MSAFDDYVIAHANCTNYWPLRSNGVATKGSIDLTLSNVTFSGLLGGMGYFTTGASAVSAATINLTATDKITIISRCILNATTWGVSTYGLFTLGTAGEDGHASITIDSAGDGHSLNPHLYVINTGNVGSNSNIYDRQDSIGGDFKVHFFSATYDFSITNPENKLYSDGSLITRTGPWTTSNNTGSFGDKLFRVGINTINLYMSNVAIFNTVLSASEIGILNGLLNGSSWLGLNGAEFKLKSVA
jgi:hypothetical protein